MSPATKFFSQTKVRKNQVVETIEALCDVEESDETRGAAHNLLPAICDFSIISFLFSGVTFYKKLT
jgi:hypothetical protein